MRRYELRMVVRTALAPVLVPGLLPVVVAEVGVAPVQDRTAAANNNQSNNQINQINQSKHATKRTVRGQLRIEHGMA